MVTHINAPSLLQVFRPKQNDYVYYDRFYGRSVTADTALSGEEQREGVEHWVWPVEGALGVASEGTNPSIFRGWEGGGREGGGGEEEVVRSQLCGLWDCSLSFDLTGACL